MTRSLLFAAALSLAALLPLQAQDTGHPLPAALAAQRVRTLLRSVEWSNSLTALQTRAEREGKLVLWIQLVGKLDDGL